MVNFRSKWGGMSIYVRMRKGSKMSPESRLKMSLAHFGKPSNHTGHCHSEESKVKMSASHSVPRPWMRGRKATPETIKKLRTSHLGVLHNESHRQATSNATRNAWRDPIKRRRMLTRCRWKNTMADKGQLELLKRWNDLGFAFIPNYQVKTEADLFYVDGYDPIHNVVLEYDSKYHTRTRQLQKDIIRQTKIIDILKPKKFWRYDAVNKRFKNVL